MKTTRIIILPTAVVVVACVVSQQTSYADIDGIGNGAGWALNGYYLYNQYGPARVDVFNRITLTDLDYYSTKSAFYQTPQNIAGFEASFVWWTGVGYDGYNPGDGFTFIVQRYSPYAVGGPGGSLGYAAGGGFSSIPSSVGLAYNMMQNGVALASSGNIGGYSSLAPVYLHSNHQIQFDIRYDGQNLTQSILDLSTGNRSTSSYALNIPNIVGGDTAYVGFTAGSGRAYGNQFVTSFSYISTVPEPSIASLMMLGGALYTACLRVCFQRRR